MWVWTDPQLWDYKLGLCVKNSTACSSAHTRGEQSKHLEHEIWVTVKRMQKQHYEVTVNHGVVIQLTKTLTVL